MKRYWLIILLSLVVTSCEESSFSIRVVNTSKFRCSVMISSDGNGQNVEYSLDSGDIIHHYTEYNKLDVSFTCHAAEEFVVVYTVDKHKEVLDVFFPPIVEMKQYVEMKPSYDDIWTLLRKYEEQN